MKKFVIFILTFILYSPPVWADMSDHGRLSDIPGYHGNDGFGWVIIIIIVMLCTMFDKDEK